MAQREAKKEEMELQVSATLILCANNCGFYGNPATKNLCQSCFKASLAAPRTPPSSSSGEGRAGPGPIRSPAAEKRKEEEEEKEKGEVVAAKGRKEVNRCFGCRRKVGLVGFRCRCGEVFCGEHRYSDRHDCSYDYKAAGRAAIERENPVVRAAKIVRV